MTGTPELSGIIPILFAFFDSSGALDRAAMQKQVYTMRRLGAPAIAVLGLATEVNKLNLNERHNVINWAAEDLAGSLPLIVTINGDTVDDQIALARYAHNAGANWLVLQPPSQRTVQAAVQAGVAENTESYCSDFFRKVLCAVPLPAGIQNAPEYMGIGLSAAGIANLARHCPNLRLLKGEGPSVVIREVIDALGGQLPVFNGRGGQELLDNLRAGCAGMIVAPDTWDWQQRVFAALQQGRDSQAEQLYQQVLPAIVFVMQSLDALICYGKRIAAWRMGIETVYDRSPGLQPTAFGLAAARRFADQLGPLG